MAPRQAGQPEGARDTDQDWTLVAETDPYWGVLSAEEFRGTALAPDTLARFMASGEAFVAELWALVEHHLRPGFQPGRVLDFGCGVGRLLLPMARRSARAVGVDVAPRMLEMARQHAAQAGLTNVELVPAEDDDLANLGGGFELINSYIVLQHIPPARGLRLLRALLARLAPGGIGSLQLTYAKERRFLLHEAPRARYYRRDGGALLDLGATAAEPPPGTITVFDYDLNEVAVLLADAAAGPVLALPTRHDGHLGIHYLFRRG